MKFTGVLIGICLAIVLSSGEAQAQNRGVGVTLDSLLKLEKSTDSLIAFDSLKRELAKPPKQFATYREIDLTNDGKPEEIRLFAKVLKDVDKIQFDFTIRSRGQMLYSDKWTAEGYFDPADKLTDSTKLARLRRIVLVFLANENFVVLDSAKFNRLLAETTPADVIIDSKEARELATGDRVMYSVFAGRDNFYGLVWLPSKKRFVKAWQN
ncbi:MAG TPA: hypothetical protein VFH43_07335 [Candidatus Kapabacteria bacterium]|nr:hypothetical protein [Candidatus Kapabacteria bacterium]